MAFCIACRAGIGGVMAALVLAACGGDSDGDAGAAGAAGSAASGASGGSGGTGGGGFGGELLDGDCDPLVPTYCGLPFPSDVYLKPDPDGKTPSGRSVRFGKTTLPRALGTTPVDPALFHDLDGFSTGQAPMTHLPGAVPDGLPDPDTIADSLRDDSPTILLEADTLQRVAHFVDIDYSHDQDDRRMLMIRPVVRPKDSTRYIVAIRGVKNAAGDVIEPSEAFVALRDGTSSPEKSVELRRALYDDIFARLDQAGVARDDLQIAWDYTTASREGTTRVLLAMRDAALDAVGDDGPEYVVDSVEENPNSHIRYRIHLTMTVPLFLNHPDLSTDPAPALSLGADGLAVQNGTMRQEVLVHVPNSVATGERHGILQNGHGLFGSPEEGQDGYLAEMADGWKWIAVSTKLFGFSGEDVSLAINALGARPALLKSIVARQHQGHVNQLLAMRMMIGRVAKEGIRDASGRLLLAPEAIDRELRAYRGDSQGGIMGTVYVALSTDVTRGLVGEAGMPYNLLLNRSVDWPPFEFVLKASYEDGLAFQLVTALLQMHWDHTEPNGWAPYLSTGELPGTPVHRLLIHDALGDHQVTTYGTHILARAVDAVNMKSDAGELVRDVWGLPAESGPIGDRNVLVEYDFALAKEPLVNQPATDGDDPHDRVRGLAPSYEQSDRFFRTGTVEWFCDGVCNCDGPGAEEGC
jgi:hypothetical protein